MKTLKTIIFASAALIAASACTKEVNPKEESVPSAPGTIEVNVTALIGDLAPSEGTKATMDPVIRLTWENNDKVYAYDAKKCLGELTVTPIEGGSSAKLSGTLSEAAAGTTKITLVYCTGTTPTMTDNKLSFDLSTQDAAANPFVVYATLDYTAGQTSITDKIVPFNFATSLMRVTATGLTKNKSITEATVSGVNTKCELTVNAGSAPAVAGITSGSISRTGTDSFTKSDGRAIFNVSVAAEATTNDKRTLTINQGTLKYGSKLMSGEIAAGQSIISVYALTEQTGSRGVIGSYDYVYVAGKKWATQNLAIYRNDQTSGSARWKPSVSNVKVPGTTTSVVVGDYFQWGVYPNHTTATNFDKGLLIYESFSNLTISKDSQTPFSFKSDKQFNKATSPYGGSAYTKYINDDISYRPNLDLSDDVAHTILGNTWRMPTGGWDGEFGVLFYATYWAWDDDDKGYYVYEPQEGDAGKINNNKVSAYTYNKADALLFFPAAGRGNDGDLKVAGNQGFYWSSTGDGIHLAECFYFYDGQVSPQCALDRYCGCSVRPLSD